MEDELGEMLIITVEKGGLLKTRQMRRQVMCWIITVNSIFHSAFAHTCKLLIMVSNLQRYHIFLHLKTQFLKRCQN
jgi:hypothetical protein